MARPQRATRTPPRRYSHSARRQMTTSAPQRAPIARSGARGASADQQIWRVMSRREAPSLRDRRPSLVVCWVAPVTFTQVPQRDERVVTGVVIERLSVRLGQVVHGFEQRQERRQVVTVGDLTTVRTPRASFDAENVATVNVQGSG